MEIFKGEETKKFILKFLREVADVNIKDYTVADSIVLEHEIDNKVYTMNIEEESTGVKLLFALAPKYKKAIEDGYIIELHGADGILHPLVLKKLERIFAHTKK